MKFSIVLVLGSLGLVGCSNPNPMRPESTAKAPSTEVESPVSPTADYIGARSPDAGFGFNGVVSGFPTGKVFLTGGGTFDLSSRFVRSSGGFRCLDDVKQGPLSTSINENDPGPCLSGEGVRWDTAELLTGTMFKCTGAGIEPLKQATTSDKQVVLQADFYRAGNGNDESFTAQIIVSNTDLDPDTLGVQNLWVQGVGCGEATVNFNR